MSPETRRKRGLLFLYLAWGMLSGSVADGFLPAIILGTLGSLAIAHLIPREK